MSFLTGFCVPSFQTGDFSGVADRKNVNGKLLPNLTPSLFVSSIVSFFWSTNMLYCSMSPYVSQWL